MGNLGPMEILMIVAVALLLFGAGRIADIGKGLGQGIKNFKQGLKEASELDDDKRPAPAAPVQAAPAAALPPAPAAAPVVGKEDPSAKAS